VSAEPYRSPEVAHAVVRACRRHSAVSRPGTLALGSSREARLIAQDDVDVRSGNVGAVLDQLLGSCACDRSSGATPNEWPRASSWWSVGLKVTRPDDLSTDGNEHPKEQLWASALNTIGLGYSDWLRIVPIECFQAFRHHCSAAVWMTASDVIQFDAFRCIPSRFIPRTTSYAMLGLVYVHVATAR